jgi:drug/metabolite transporter (DMT)-like permease
LKSIPQASVNAWAMAYGTVFMSALALLTGQPIAFDPGIGYVVSLAYLAVFHSAIGFLLYLTLVRRITMERAAYFTVVYPVLALTLSTFFEGYQWTLQAAMGLVLVLGGNVFILRTRKPQKPG